MAEHGISRGAFRDRHGRGIRRPVLSNLYRHGETRIASFNQIVRSTCEFLQSVWPEELANLKWLVLDSPSIREDSQSVRRWATKKAEMTVCIFRVPIERLGHARRADPMHERMHIEENVFLAVAHLLDKEPWELVPERYRPE
ncbi:MAG: hypothetical protein ACKOWI_05305 [Rhodoluna sp.]